MNNQRVWSLGYEGTQYTKHIHNKREEAPDCLKQSEIVLKVVQGLVQKMRIINY